MNAPNPARPAHSTRPAGQPSGPLTSAELAAAVPDPEGRERYRRIWHGMYRRDDQPDDLLLRSRALARTWPEGVLRGRSAALLWGDDSVPRDALPEIWLPATRKSRPGRVYRYGSMPAWAVTQIDGLSVTSPLRTCRDLAGDLSLEDAVVSVERLCAVVAELPAQLQAAVDHPAGRGAQRFVEVVRAVEPRSGSPVTTRARLTLAAAGCEGFGHGHRVRLATRTVELPLADPAARCVVFAPGNRPSAGLADAARYGAQLAQAGWTVIVVRGRSGPPGAAAIEAGAGAGAEAAPLAALGPAPASSPAAAPVAARAAAALRARWPATEVLAATFGEPTAGPTADPHGMWGGSQN